MSVPNPIPHKTLYINDYICSCYAFVFIFEFSEYISKHILQFHASRVYGMHQLSGHANTAIIQLLFVSLRPTFINGSARQINDDFTGFHASA